MTAILWTLIIGLIVGGIAKLSCREEIPAVASSPSCSVSRARLLPVTSAVCSAGIDLANRPVSSPSVIGAMILLLIYRPDCRQARLVA
jgi:hypothetical protein